MFQSTTANNKSQKNSFGSPSTHEEEQKASQPQKIFRTGFDGSVPIDFVSQSGSNAATAQLASNDKEEELQMKAKEEEELPLQGKNIVKEKIQKKSASSSGSTAMPNDVQTKMESSFGTDFSGVNIYANDQSTTQMGALAYTQGTMFILHPDNTTPAHKKDKNSLVTNLPTLFNNDKVELPQQPKAKVWL